MLTPSRCGEASALSPPLLVEAARQTQLGHEAYEGMRMRPSPRLYEAASLCHHPVLQAGELSW
jgi:hypothetical protein